MNNVVLMGRMVRDPELRFSSSGKAFARFTIAVNRTKDNTDFISCVAWEKTAESIAEYFRKGQRILLQGSIQTGSYEKNGQTVYTTDVLVNRFEFVESNSSSSGSGYSQQSFNNNNNQAVKNNNSFEDDNDDMEDDEEFPF